MTTPTRTLYVFLDESGDMVFGPKASGHFILSAVYTDDPCVSAARLQDLKYDLMSSGSGDLEFHATENSKGTRARVADRIRELENIRVHTLWIDKRYTHPSKQDPVELFSIFGTAMGKWLGTVVAKEHDQVIMIFDSVLTKKQQSAFKAAVKPKLKSLHVPFRLLFHPVKSDMNGQIADYFSWAWYRLVESHDEQPRTSLKGIYWTEFNLFRYGHTEYWKR
ncbi:DUF3800 domain-containing protein [Rhodococcus sp. ZPP]|uniref:DUF3800 domain-containing protein n=1 Tax=Rhodococcus sp. ZPP TaxID=2749906 RepID=UPI001AD854FB|nr:DUF3800 domain-containing protein [Rhodococcus sp. ZPP]QTJ64957.1 DUF3800 domain-containing protein [Rhodococcus sp. ZPP]